MLWASTLLLVTVASANVPAPGPIESTYDEAACALTDKDAGTGAPALAEDGGRCTEPQPAATPTVIDCNDPDFSVWVGDMIGSCDMPGPSNPAPVPAVRARDDGPLHVCDGLFCGDDTSPMRAAAPSVGDGQPFVLPRLPIHHLLESAPLSVRGEPMPEELTRPRLDRPPRLA